MQHLQIDQGEIPDSRFFSREKNAAIRIVRLKDGLILAPVQDSGDFQSIQGHVSLVVLRILGRNSSLATNTTTFMEFGSFVDCPGDCKIIFNSVAPFPAPKRFLQ